MKLYAYDSEHYSSGKPAIENGDAVLVGKELTKFIKTHPDNIQSLINIIWKCCGSIAFEEINDSYDVQ